MALSDPLDILCLCIIIHSLLLRQNTPVINPQHSKSITSKSSPSWHKASLPNVSQYPVLPLRKSSSTVKPNDPSVPPPPNAIILCVLSHS
mmetsp:Transcript_22793/g.33942  ORF Transcript_22793/g.33942 Transcript_22793/m.33942 type:complete len:90 (-) Transcript_22793:1488-1757(-)